MSGIPRADLAQGTRLDAGNRQKYKRVQTLLELVAGAEYEETYSKHETNKMILSHGKLEVVDEMDITTIRMKMCITCWKTQCICQNSSNDATASECSATESGKSERELPRVEVPQNTKPQHYVKADGSPLDRPDDAPWPFTILFVGVDNGEKTDPDLNLKGEFEKIEQAYRESKVYHGSSRVLIKRLLFSKWSEVLIEIRKEAPTMLQFGCHAQKGKGFELFRQIVDPHEMLNGERHQKLEQICARTKSTTAANPHYCVKCLRF